MSKIKFFGLGGLGENGKNMFVCEVDERIFVLDAGLKYPSVDLYGIDTILPDFQYLRENKNRIQGVFLSHGHEDHIGAIPEFLKEFNVNVFGTHFTISIVEDALQEAGLNIKNYHLYRINQDKKLSFGDVTVQFYNVSHSIPESINIAICTKDGAIVFAPDFCLDTNTDRRYQTSYAKINEIAKNGVLALAPESLGTSNINRAPNNIAFDHEMIDALQKNQRLIVSVYSTDLDRIQRIINLSVEHNRRVAILGIKTQKIVNIAINCGYLKVPENKLVNLKFIDDTHHNDDKDLVVIVAGNRHEPFFMLLRMCKHLDRLIQITNKDLVYLVTPPMNGTEKIANSTLDLLARSGATVVNLKKNILKSSHADSEDLKMLYSMLNPKYIIPIVGEFRHQYQQKQIILDAGYSEERTIMLDNGDVAYFENGSYKGKIEKVSVGDVLVDGSIVGDINEVVMKDRELLAQEGVVIVAIVIESNTRTIISGPEIVFKGFSIHDSDTELMEELKDMIAENVYSFMYKKYINWDKAQDNLREKIINFIKKQMNKNPIVMVTINDINIKQ
ncbi:MAG: ribonuclease J [Acholeplasmataceae bacterium]|nr:ribonuclease J [Acholeplasmataceae bacterium]